MSNHYLYYKVRKINNYDFVEVISVDTLYQHLYSGKLRTQDIIRVEIEGYIAKAQIKHIRYLSKERIMITLFDIATDQDIELEFIC